MEYETSLPCSFTLAEYNCFLDNINKRTVLLEYGAGISTLRLSRHVNFLHSIEHDRIWYDKVKLALRRDNINNVQIYHVPPNVGDYDYCAEDNEILNTPYGKDLFDKYINYADRLEFTDVFIDGRARMHCANKVHSRMGKDSILFLHDFNREFYKVVLEKYRVFKQVDKLVLLRAFS